MSDISLSRIAPENSIVCISYLLESVIQLSSRFFVITTLVMNEKNNEFTLYIED